MNCELKFIVIGITDNPKPFFTPEVLEIIKNGRVFSGGKRHHEIVAPLLPKDAHWIDITVPLDKVFEEYNGQWSMVNGQCIIVFASGDPLFFGFANTIKRKMPEVEIVVYPTFNSLQMLAHKLVMPYHDMRIVSLTGRPWQEFDKALIERAEKIGVLTDKEHTPSAIAQRMMEYGYTNYIMYVGEHLGNPELEKVTSLSLEEASAKDFSMPNCVILDGETVEHTKTFGISDSAFALLDGREKMITKMPIRLLTLQALELPKRRVFWDIGFCTGSVSIEARLQFPHLQIEAFEIRPECEAIIKENAHRFGAPDINIHMGDFLANCDSVATNGTPDAVFIGGHGGRLKEIMEKVLTVLAPDGVIVFNSVTSPKVSTNSRQLWDEACKELDLRQEAPLRIQLNDFNPIEILKCKR
ncbi:MAG: precorrin-6y C5,15-methyltransferase (decarboxylating) subunit CbiE [Bacteroidaceae bacterium]|nr:precorrin-6y C5,15-methyltransferase (decarboxylating) subunit CbiE [Bacteroidaceae bacterium]